MKKPPFQFGLKAAFKATTVAAAVMAFVHYVPSTVLAIAAACLLYVVSIVVSSVLAANLFCIAFDRLIQGRKPPDA